LPQWQTLFLQSVTAASAVATVAAQQARKRAVFPHTVNKSDKYGGAAAGENSVDTVPAATCRKQ